MRAKIILFIGIAVMCCTLFGGCHTSQNVGKKTIPYTVADRYFVRNDVTGLPPATIMSDKEFEKYFGMATVMGTNGSPTKIDFNKSFVICVALAPTDIDTDLSAVSLTDTNSNKLVLRYGIKRGKKMSYTSQPLLLLVVDKKYEKPVVLEAEDK